ncbi:MAG: protein kinase [Bacteroidota bacterium]|jgi:serine/threonine-protein kinase
MIGQTISHYQILEKLGEGGMGVVYKAQDTKLDRTVALKFLPAHVSVNADTKARFLQEAKAAAALNHANICTIYGVDESDGTMFIAMEYIEGGTLREKIPFPKVDDGLNVAIQIGEALQEAHSKGIVHRDIKADNIMLTSKGQAKVMDFGLAKLKGSLKLTKTSSTVGTLGYMAPEQIQGGEVDHRSDIFSFGVLLFEMLTGKLPFRGEHEAAIVYSIVHEEPELLTKYVPDAPSALTHILGRALEKDPDDRYQSIADMVSEIRRGQKKSARVTRPFPAENATPLPPPADEKPVAGRIHAPGKKTIIISVVVLLAVLVVLVYFFTGRQQSITSLAVLPFENVGASPDQEYLSDGVTESLINNLTKISSLRVVPRSTVFRFKGKEMDIQDIGTKLNVGAVLSGRITHRGESLDVQVDLIDIKRESQLWGNHYQASMADLLSLQQQITNEVSSKLGIGISTETREKITKRATENTQAYQLYLQGRYYWNRRTAASISQAIDYFKQAITIDSTYALAHVGLSDCYILQSQYAGIPTRITIPLTQKFARRALELDNSLAEAHATLAMTLYEEWKYEEAEREFKLAISLNPRYPTAYQWYNVMLARTGRIDEASVMVQKAFELDPVSPVITVNVGALALARGQYDEALRYFKKSVELDPSFATGYSWVGLVQDRLNQHSEARVNLEKGVELSGRSSECIAYLGYFYGKRGMRAEAMKLVKENEQRYKAGTGSAYNIARIYAGLGEKEKTLDYLEQDLRDRSSEIGFLLMDITMDDVRTSPRFIAILKTVGLVK